MSRSERPEKGTELSLGFECGIYETTNTARGGGGAGRIRIKTADGSPAISGTVSPSEASGCVSFGTLP